MTISRWILLSLLVIGIGVMVVYFIWLGVELEYLTIIYVVPVVVMNAWEWSEPEFMEKMVEVFGKKKERELSMKDTKSQEGKENFLDW